MPGEYLWRRVIAQDEADMQWLAVFALGLILVGSGVLCVAARHLQSSPVVVLVSVIVVFVFSLLVSVRWCQQRLGRRANYYLGFFGERHVGECLDPLKGHGWFIFHDIPCLGGAGKFNLDHVAVGPGGLWVVETKTRRKGNARPGFKEHEVFFDGVQIIWPQGEDRSALTQASQNARWLRDWLEQMTAKTFDVASVLAIPGYCVIEQKLGPVRLANPKNLPGVLIGRGKTVLREEEIDLIRRQLEEKCRDVEY
jgi:hypothetical protein